EKALEEAGLLLPAWTAAARIAEAAGLWADAAVAYRQLADRDRRRRVEHLTRLARLEARLGRKDRAPAAGRARRAAAAARPRGRRTDADLCSQLGDAAEGLEALRRAVRLNRNDPEALTALARALADQFHTAEAIELYWRAFDGAESVEARLPLVAR